jgi:diaminopimelate decarboxylase
MLHKNLTINDQSHLCIAGKDTVELAQKYGTPLMVMDEARIRRNFSVYKNAME